MVLFCKDDQGFWQLQSTPGATFGVQVEVIAATFGKHVSTWHASFQGRALLPPPYHSVHKVFVHAGCGWFAILN